MLVDQERAEVDRERQEDEVMAMDLTGMDAYRVNYFHERTTGKGKLREILQRRLLLSCTKSLGRC